MPTVGDNNIRVVQLTGAPSGAGPYTIVETPISSGNYAVTDIGGFSFIIPAPIKAQMLQDLDGDTHIRAIESGGANGGDKLQFTVDNIVVGSVEILAGGLTKWTLNGILDPIVYAGTP